MIHITEMHLNTGILFSVLEMCYRTLKSCVCRIFLRKRYDSYILLTVDSSAGERNFSMAKTKTSGLLNMSYFLECLCTCSINVCGDISPYFKQ